MCAANVIPEPHNPPDNRTHDLPGGRASCMLDHRVAFAQSESFARRTLQPQPPTTRHCNCTLEAVYQSSQKITEAERVCRDNERSGPTTVGRYADYPKSSAPKARTQNPTSTKNYTAESGVAPTNPSTSAAGVFRVRDESRTTFGMVVELRREASCRVGHAHHGTRPGLGLPLIGRCLATKSAILSNRKRTRS